MGVQLEFQFKRTCCCSLRTGSIAIATIFIVASSIMAILCTYSLAAQAHSPHRIHWDNFLYYSVMAVYIVVLVVSLMYTLLNILLIIGIRKGEYNKADSWLIWTGILFILRVIILVLIFFDAQDVPTLLLGFPNTFGLVELGALVFNGYALWVVSGFAKELKAHKAVSQVDKCPQPLVEPPTFSP